MALSRASSCLEVQQGTQVRGGIFSLLGEDRNLDSSPVEGDEHRVPHKGFPVGLNL